MDWTRPAGHPTAERALDRVRALVALVRDRELTFLAAAIAYYAFVSLVPLLLLVLVGASLLVSPSFGRSLTALVGRALTPVAGALLADTLAAAATRAPATVVGLTLLVWSTLKVFRGIDVAFSRLYGTDPGASFASTLVDSVIALSAVGVGVAAVVVVGVLVSFSGVELAGFVGTLLLVTLLAAIFFPLFYLFPDAEVTVREVLPGTLFAAVGWTLLGTLFRVYAGVAGSFALYGVLGAVLLLVTWFYVGSLVVLLGAAVNVVLADRAGQTGNYNRPRSDNAG